jgi:diguanylate cyclase (GGDEF)-like protein/putative nucleotidyltransferase with HDIG domain
MMNFADKMRRMFVVPTHMFVAGEIVLGFLCFLLLMNFTIPSPSEWVILYAFVGSVLMLNFFPIALPPEGNGISMETSVFLTCIFLFGVDTSLTVLLLSSVLFAIYKRDIALWKYCFNFSSYSLSITGAYFSFIATGGVIGSLDTHHIYPYLLALSVYFFINVMVFGIYYFLAIQGNLFNVLKGILKETIVAYIITLLFSLVLCLLPKVHFYFGLFLFLSISVLLSIAFKQLFVLYQTATDKATHDQRTGLYNHGYIEEMLVEELTHAKNYESSFSLAMLDLDNFKTYNDKFGHMQGDKLLEFVGTFLKNESNDCNVARYGGEEFAILLPGKTNQEAFSIINALRKKLNDSYFEGAEIFPHGCISFSAGIIAYDRSIYDKSQLFDKASQAMYYAKAQGKNMVHIYNEESIVQKTIDFEKDILEIEHQLKLFLSKDIYTFQHSKRVFSYAIDICEFIPLSESEKKTLVLGSLFHDIGKLEVPKIMLKKKGKLTAEEWDIIKNHVVWGREIVASIDKYKELIPLVELHHERVDGKGYPYGLKGEEIPHLARILCIIDSFDAMTTERPYQPTRTFDEAILELRSCAGKQFDENYVEPFIQMLYSKYDFKLKHKIIN